MDIEKLLGKLLSEAVSSGGSQFKKNLGSHGSAHATQTHRPGADSLLAGLTSQLTSGKGLMTAIGLGVGAYEIYRSSSQPVQAPSLPASGPAASPPPPPPSAPVLSAAIPPAPAPQSGPDEQEVARRMIQVMVGAAHADGRLDADEEKKILDRLRTAALSQEEKMFLLEELHNPRPMAELAHGIVDVRLAQTMYALAASAVEVDTPGERQWLDQLGAALGLSPERCRFIEENR